MVNEVIFSVSGVRGIVGEGLTAELALRVAAAFGTHLQGGRVALSRDGRPSGSMMRHAVLAGLLGTGCSVLDLGIAPTPTCGYAITHEKLAGGIQITASHNPAEWNGLKLFGSQGGVIPGEEGGKVQAILHAGSFRQAAWNEIGTAVDCPQALDWHRRKALSLIDAERVRSQQYPVFLDANGGAGGPLGYSLLSELACVTISHACDASGSFIHAPEPIAENLRDIAPLVAQNGAAIGFVLDPDADRLALIDEKGRYIGEELTLALAVLFRLRQERGPVVVNMSTSRVIEDIARRFDCPCYRSAVGEANVTSRMRAVGAVIGGEGNGGVIDPRVGPVRDPFIGMGLILNLMAETGKKLSELVADLPAYHIVKDKYPTTPARLPALFHDLENRWPEASANKLDGLRLDWPDRWVHIRPSNTEPIVRVIAEAPQREEAEKLCREVGAKLTT